MVDLNDQDGGTDINQSFPVEVCFVPMFAPSGSGKIILAERARFSELLDFVEVEFYRGLAMGKGNRTPAQKEYDRTYNQLKVRKQRGKISKGEWNTAVAKAQELVARSERGELSDDELKRKPEEL